MSARADNGDGSCKEILTGKHAGKWRVQFTLEDEFARKSRVSRIFPTKTEAREFLKGLRHGVKIVNAQRSKELTLGAWFDWLAQNDWPESLADRTIGGRISHFDNYVRPVLGNIPLKRIDPVQVRAFFKALRSDGVGTPTIHGIKRELVRVYNQAINPYGRVPITQANPFRLELSGADPRIAVALTPEQGRRAILHPDLTPEQRAMLGLLLLAGVRTSEQMALTRGQILFDQHLIYIDRAVKFDRKGKQTIGLPKRKKRRLAVMCPTLEALLREVTDGLLPDDYVWPGPFSGEPRMVKLVYATWRVIRQTAKLPESMMIKDCRLTHINWIEKLMPEVSKTTLQEHVGHAAQGVTEVNYTRPLTNAQDILRKSIESLVNPRQPQRRKSAA